MPTGFVAEIGLFSVLDTIDPCCEGYTFSEAVSLFAESLQRY